MHYGGFNPDLEKQHQSDKDWQFGSASAPCLALIPESEREKYLPVGEVQVGRQDTQDCVTRAYVNKYEAKFTWLYRTGKMLPANAKWFEDAGFIDDLSLPREQRRAVFSDAFPAILSGTTRNGNSLKAPIEAIRVNGLIPKKLLPLEPWMLWDDYHDPKRITPEHLEIGQEFLRRWPLGYDRVDASDFPVVLEQDFIIGAVFAWPRPVNGEYPRTEEPFNHAILAFARPLYKIFDNYPDLVDADFIKKLVSSFRFFDYGYRAFITKENNPADRAIQVTVFETLLKYGLLNFFADWWDRFTRSVRGFLDPGSLGKARSREWSRVRAEHLKKHPTCAVCGGTKDLEVHHKLPFHLHPELELSEQNLISFCRDHHLLVGHLMSFKSYNDEVDVDANYLKARIRNRP